MLPTLSINNVSVTEGNTGTKSATLTVTLSAASNAPVTVRFATANGTATAGSDYVARSGTLTFPAGITTQPIVITINGDTVVEPNEIFTVNLSNATGATIAIAQGIGTIVNDDQAPLPTLSINNVNIAEGNTGARDAVLTVTLSAPSATRVTVNFATQDGTAMAGSDYNARTGTLAIAAGQTQGTIAIGIRGDTVVEPNEPLFVNLSNAVGATIVGGRGRITIIDDDVVTPPRADLRVTQTVNPTSVAVGQTAVFTITVTNGGPNNATNVVMDDTLPAGATFVSANPAPATNQNGVLRFNIGALNVGQSRVISVTLRLNAAGTITNRAVASSPISDPVQANNAAAASASAGPQNVTPQITVTSSAFTPIGGYIAGLFTPRRVAQTVTLRNNGATLAGPISLVLNNLSSNARLSNATGQTTATLPPAGRPYISVTSGLAANATTTLRLEFTVSNNGNVTYTPVVIAGPGTR